LARNKKTGTIEYLLDIYEIFIDMYITDSAASVHMIAKSQWIKVKDRLKLTKIDTASTARTGITFRKVHYIEMKKPS
jgi:hypothetical protein